MKYLKSTTSPFFPNATTGCPADWSEMLLNSTSPVSPPSSSDPLPGYLPLYELSYMWYSALGIILTIIPALMVSMVWPQDVRRMDRRLLSPALASIIQVSTERENCSNFELGQRENSNQSKRSN